MNSSKRLDLLLWFRLSRFYNDSLRMSNQHLKEYELTAAQFDVIAQVGIKGHISQQELGGKLFVTKGNITQLLKRLESRELIERKQEWKTKYISLTEKGKVLYHQVVPAQENFQSEQFSKLTEDEKKQFNELLKKIHQ